MRILTSSIKRSIKAFFSTLSFCLLATPTFAGETSTESTKLFVTCEIDVRDLWDQFHALTLHIVIHHFPEDYQTITLTWTNFTSSLGNGVTNIYSQGPVALKTNVWYACYDPYDAPPYNLRNQNPYQNLTSLE